MLDAGLENTYSLETQSSTRTLYSWTVRNNTLKQLGQILSNLLEHYRLCIGHDYPPDSRAGGAEARNYTLSATGKEQTQENKYVKAGTTEEKLGESRPKKDSVLDQSRLLHQALQFNIRAEKLQKVSIGWVFR